MLAELIAQIIKRDLKTLQRELEAYADEKDIWSTPPGITNSAGTLARHLVGNLRHFIGAQIGGNGYIRDRETEFSGKDIPRDDLLEEIKITIQDVEPALAQVSMDQLHEKYPLAIGGVQVQTSDWLLHLMSHLTYHLGQLDYHRRVVTGQFSGVGALAIPELKTAVPAS